MVKRFKEHILSEKRNGIIDFIRGLSLLMVINSHFGIIGYVGLFSSTQLFGRSLGEIESGMGYYGVVIFFVISGFLITSLTLRRYQSLDKIRVLEFWWYRFSRIMPMLTLCIVAIVSLALFHIPGFSVRSPQHLMSGILAILSFRYNHFIGTLPSAWDPIWSLSVEEMFYFGFPFVCLYLTGTASTVFIFLTTFTAVLYFKSVQPSLVFSTLGCVHYLAFGCLLAILNPSLWFESLKSWKKKILTLFLVITGLGLIAYSVISHGPFNSQYSTLVCALGAGLEIISSQLLNLTSKKLYLLLPITLLGISSYEAYLLHMPLRDLLSLVGIQNVGLQLLIIISLSLVLNFAFTEPMNRCLRHYRSDKQKGLHPLRKLVLHTLPLICALLMVPACYTQITSKPATIKLSFVAIVSLPNQTIEPIAILGHKSAGDMVFLKHLDTGYIQLGIDHWGKPSVLSERLEISKLLNTTLVITFGSKRTEVTQAGRVLLANSTAPYTHTGDIVVGMNNEGFSSALDVSLSKTIVVY